MLKSLCTHNATEVKKHGRLRAPVFASEGGSGLSGPKRGSVRIDPSRIVPITAFIGDIRRCRIEIEIPWLTHRTRVVDLLLNLIGCEHRVVELEAAQHAAIDLITRI